MEDDTIERKKGRRLPTFLRPTRAEWKGILESEDPFAELLARDLIVSGRRDGKHMGQVDPDGPDSCWFWQWDCVHGYPRVLLADGERVYVHKLIATIRAGREPAGLLTTDCGNRGCIRPDHIRRKVKPQSYSKMLDVWSRREVRRRVKKYGRWVLLPEDFEHLTSDMGEEATESRLTPGDAAIFINDLGLTPDHPAWPEWEARLTESEGPPVRKTGRGRKS